MALTFDRPKAVVSWLVNYYDEDTGELKFRVQREPPDLRNELVVAAIAQSLTYGDEAFHSRTIADLELSIRTSNSLKARGVNTIGDLLQYRYRDLAVFPGMGKKALREVVEVLEYMGHRLDP